MVVRFHQYPCLIQIIIPLSHHVLRIPELGVSVYIYIYLMIYVIIVEGSVEVKLPTIRTDEKAEVERVREEKRRRKKIKEEKVSEERKSRCGKR